MSIEDQINVELARLKLLPLVEEQAQCLRDASRLEEAAGMLADLRDRCRVRLPLPSGSLLGGPYTDEGEAREQARSRLSAFPVVAVDHMATDESRSSGDPGGYYVTGYAGPDGALVIAERHRWVALWFAGQEQI